MVATMSSDGTSRTSENTKRSLCHATRRLTLCHVVYFSSVLLRRQLSLKANLEKESRNSGVNLCYMLIINILRGQNSRDNNYLIHIGQFEVVVFDSFFFACLSSYYLYLLLSLELHVFHRIHSSLSFV